MKWSFVDLAKLARLSAVAYEPSKAAVEDLGMEYLGQVTEAACPATLAMWGGLKVICYQGTRITENFDIDEVWDDLGMLGIPYANWGNVSEGMWRRMASTWGQIGQVLGPNPWPLLLCGHSLGGAHAHLAGCFAPQAEVVSFGAPQAADASFWRRCYPHDPPTRVVLEHDFAPDWGVYWTTQPGAMLWLHGGTAFEDSSVRDALNLSIDDHRIENYAARLEALA